MILCACAQWSESEHFLHVLRHFFFAWLGLHYVQLGRFLTFYLRICKLLSHTYTHTKNGNRYRYVTYHITKRLTYIDYSTSFSQLFSANLQYLKKNLSSQLQCITHAVYITTRINLYHTVGKFNRLRIHGYLSNFNQKRCFDISCQLSWNVKTYFQGGGGGGGRGKEEKKIVVC